MRRLIDRMHSSTVQGGWSCARGTMAQEQHQQPEEESSAAYYIEAVTAPPLSVKVSPSLEVKRGACASISIRFCYKGVFFFFGCL
jgi:hypothetical protein